MNKKKFTKLLALYLPYLVIGLAATNFGTAADAHQNIQWVQTGQRVCKCSRERIYE